MSDLLDRSRAFGTVTPPENGAHYAQDGHFFDSSWRRIYLPGETPPKSDPMAKARAAKAAKKGEPEGEAKPVDGIYKRPPWRRHTPKATFTPKDGDGRKRKFPRSVQNRVKPNAAPRAAESVRSPEVNLTAWARGEQKILFGMVRDTIRSRFNVVVNQEHDALDVLIKEGVVRTNDIPGYGGSSGSIDAVNDPPE